MRSNLEVKGNRRQRHLGSAIPGDLELFLIFLFSEAEEISLEQIGSNICFLFQKVRYSIFDLFVGISHIVLQKLL